MRRMPTGSVLDLVIQLEPVGGGWEARLNETQNRHRGYIAAVAVGIEPADERQE